MSSTINNQMRPKSLSITSRLTILYTIATLAILSFAIVFQFLALVNDLEYDDSEFVADKIKILSALVANPSYDFKRLEDEIHWEGSLREHTRYMARISDSHGRVLLDTEGMHKLLPMKEFPPAAATHHAIGKGRQKTVADGRVFLLNSAWVTIKDSNDRRLIQVGLDVTEEEMLLSSYRRKMAIIFVSGVFLSAILSFLVARHGLKPLADIADSAGKITATKLNERVSIRPWPRELGQVAQAFDAMLTRLETSFNRLSDFSANLAHELRTPLNNLRGEAEVALSRVRDPDEYEKVLVSSLEEYDRLSRMVDDLLFLARAEKQGEPFLFACRDELLQLCDYFGTVAEEKDITITCTGEGVVQADRALFQRAVGNLLSNAIRYTPAGGRINLSVSTDAEASTVISIGDSGIGIPPDALPRVFDRFYRSKEARGVHASGSGLGLSIVKSIMELHNGSVKIESIPSKGTTATLLFPHTPSPTQSTKTTFN